MAHYVGLDVSLEETSICAVDESGNTVWQDKAPSEPEAIAKVISRKVPEAVKIGFETGQLSTWQWHSFKKMGLPVVCLDARHAKAALSIQVNKTDANDAYGLAQIVRTGWYREVKVKSIDAHLIRSLITARSNLVQIRTKLSNQLRAYLFEASNVLLNHVRKWYTLKAWGGKFARRTGAKKAKVAVARKLAVILHRMWSDGADFSWTEPKSA